jgi:hypothetical protein
VNCSILEAHCPELLRPRGALVRTSPSLRRAATRCSIPELLRPDARHPELLHLNARCPSCSTSDAHRPTSRFMTFFLQTGAATDSVHREGLLCPGGRRGHRARLLGHVAPQLGAMVLVAPRRIRKGSHGLGGSSTHQEGQGHAGARARRLRRPSIATRCLTVLNRVELTPLTFLQPNSESFRCCFQTKAEPFDSKKLLSPFFFYCRPLTF